MIDDQSFLVRSHGERTDHLAVVVIIAAIGRKVAGNLAKVKTSQSNPSWGTASRRASSWSVADICYRYEQPVHLSIPTLLNCFFCGPSFPDPFCKAGAADYRQVLSYGIQKAQPHSSRQRENLCGFMAI